MYQIFESNLYCEQVILELKKTLTPAPEEEIPEEEVPEEDIPEEDIPEEVPEERAPEEVPEGLPEEEMPVETPQDLEKRNFQAIQKFIIYHKLRELQYKLDDIQTINFYKNKEELVKFNKFLSYVITFFSIFDYKQASKLTERVLTEFKKIK
jgi:hypothetical protein